MPATLAHPGVYIEEIPSTARAITGVATSTTAFVGRAMHGPVDDPQTLGSYADFERVFGGLWKESRLGFAVRDFFNNGGGKAIVVRLYNTNTAPGAPPATAAIDANGLQLRAASPGSWGNSLRARIESVAASIATEAAAQLGVATTDLFNLRVRDTRTGVEEEFRNVTVVESARRIDRLLEAQSRLVRAPTPLVAPTAHAAPAPGTSVWVGNTANDAVGTPASDGLPLVANSFTGPGLAAAKKGLYALERVDLFNLLCIPPYLAASGIADQDVDPALVADAAKYCEDRRAFLIVDPPSTWIDVATAKAGITAFNTRSRNAAVYFPRLRQPNPLRDGLIDTFSPCGAVAGVMARTDASRGVWKAPAGLEAALNGLSGLSVPLTDSENGELNPLGLNCLRNFPAAGNIVWGARTLRGDDRLASEWKYIPIRRLALFIEETLFRGTQWVVFEPNDEPLWAQIRLNVGAFMHSLFIDGAFQGATPREAYFVKCSHETTTQTDIDNGIVNVEVGFAPLKPAEFVVIKIQQIALQAQV
jgi:phage tail sheath protein FI